VQKLGFEHPTAVQVPHLFRSTPFFMYVSFRYTVERNTVRGIRVDILKDMDYGYLKNKYLNTSNQNICFENRA